MMPLNLFDKITASLKNKKWIAFILICFIVIIGTSSLVMSVNTVRQFIYFIRSTLNPNIMISASRIEDGGFTKYGQIYLTALNGYTLGSQDLVYPEETWQKAIQRAEASNRYDPLGYISFLKPKEHITLFPSSIAFTIAYPKQGNFPSVNVKSIWIRYRLIPLSKDLFAGTPAIVHRHMGTVAMILKPVQGHVGLCENFGFSQIVMSDPSNPIKGLFRDRLHPGEESFYLIALDSEKAGYYRLIVDILVNYVLSNNMLNPQTAIFYDVLNLKVYRPENNQNVIYLSDIGDSILSPITFSQFIQKQKWDKVLNIIDISE